MNVGTVNCQRQMAAVWSAKWKMTPGSWAVCETTTWRDSSLVDDNLIYLLTAAQPHYPSIRALTQSQSLTTVPITAWCVGPQLTIVSVPHNY